VLDAQNQAVVAGFSVNTAAYAFLIDLANVQRATGRFEFAMGQQDVSAFFSRLNAYASKHAQKTGSP